MKRILGTIIAVSLLAGPTFAGQISVTGTGEVAVEPDMAVITIGVSHHADGANEAVTMMSDDMAAILAQLSQSGIALNQMQTSSLRVERIESYNNSTGKRSFEGFRASNRVTVTVLDLGGLGPLLDVVFKSGANNMDQLQFDVQNRAPHLEAARRGAVADAQRKAEIFADAAGVTLGDMVSLVESGARAAPVAMMEMARSSDGVPIAQGEITISATVSMLYEAE